MTEFADKPEAERMAHFITRADLVGRTVVEVRYTSDATMDAFGWHNRGVELLFDDGSQLYVLRDDEGNGPGSVQVYRDEGSIDAYCLPVF